MKSSRSRLSAIDWSLLAAGLLLVCFYFTIARTCDNFHLTDFNYFSNFANSLFGIPNPFIKSQLWKILLLLPATILFSVVFMKTGMRFHLPKRINYRLFIIALLFVAATVLVLSTQLLFRETEVTDDEIAYDFQAQTILLGRIVNPPPPIEPSFDNHFIINDGRQWIGKYTVGHPLIIAIGIALGYRHLAIIAISIMTLFLLYVISLELYNDRKIALLTLGLSVLSPFFYLVSSSRLSHTTTAFFLALFMYLFLRSRNTNKERNSAIIAFLSGIALGYAFNVRSLTALGFALPFCFVIITDFRHRKPGTLLRGIFIVVGFLLIFVPTLWYNAVVTGNALKFPFHYYETNEDLGFGVQGHTLFSAIRNLVISITRLNGVFLGFPLSLIFLFVTLFVRKKFGDRLSWGILAGIAVAYLFYFSPGVSDLGPVYYYETIIPLLILTSRGAIILHRIIIERFKQGYAFVPAFLVLSCFFSFITFVPEQVSHIRRLTELIREPYEAVRSDNIHHAVVMMLPGPKKGWILGYKNPSPKLNDDVLYCLYTDRKSNLAVVNYFNDRKAYILWYNVDSMRYEVSPVNQQILQTLPEYK